MKTATPMPTTRGSICLPEPGPCIAAADAAAGRAGDVVAVAPIVEGRMHAVPVPQTAARDWAVASTLSETNGSATGAVGTGAAYAA